MNAQEGPSNLLLQAAYSNLPTRHKEGCRQELVIESLPLSAQDTKVNKILEVHQYSIRCALVAKVATTDGRIRVRVVQISRFGFMVVNSHRIRSDSPDQGGEDCVLYNVRRA